MGTTGTASTGTRRRAWSVGRRRMTAIGSIAVAVVLLGGQAEAQDDTPPIDVDDLASQLPPPGTELDDAAAEQLLTALEGTSTAGGGNSSLTGICGGVAFSFDEDGTLIDAAYDAGDDAPPVDLLDGGQAFTSGNPFEVDTNGDVTYYGFAPRSGDGPMDYGYKLWVAGITVSSDSEEPNSNGNNRNGGTFSLSDELPVRFDAKVKAGGELTAQDGTELCAGEGYVSFSGNGIVSLPGLAGLGLLAIGVLGIVINARPARTWKV